MIPMPMSGRPSREITVVLATTVVVVWSVIFMVVFQRQPVLGGDFMQFYALGTLAWTGQWAALYDWTALHDLQVALVPNSEAYFYAPAYPPLTAALYAPFAALPFTAAFTSWAAISFALYAWLMRVVATGCGAIERHHVVIGALIFPPFVALLVTGQSTLWPLLGFVGAWWALERDKPVLAGVSFAVVAFKPHFGLALALVLLFGRSWRIVSGVVAGLVVLAGTTFAVSGPDAVSGYLSVTSTALTNPGAFDPIDARHTHAFRAALAEIASPGVVVAGWAVSVALVTWLATAAWRSREPLTVRMAALLIATLLVSPHVLLYDGVLLAPAVAWLLDRAIRLKQTDVLVAALLLSALFAVPAARVGVVPLSLPLMMWLLWRCRPQVARPA